MARSRGKSPRPPVKAEQPVVEKQQPAPVPQPQQQQQQPAAVASKLKKNSNGKAKKSTSYKSDGVEDNDVFLLPVSDYWIVLGLMVVATIVRVYRIYQPTSVVFDEVHFGGFATKYIKGKFFMDVHPPLAKMLIALTGWLAGFDGSFDFKEIGKDYIEPGVPYVAMRMFPAICGILLIPCMFLTLKAVGCRTMTAAMGSGLIIFEFKKTEQKNRLIAKIQRKKIKVLRKLMKSKKHEEEPELKRDIIEEYHNFASRVYAAIAREGLSLDKLSNKYEVQPISLTTYQGVHDLAMTIKPSLLETTINVNKLIQKIEKSYTRLEITHRQELKKAQDAIEKRLVKIVKSANDAKNIADDVKYRTATPERPHGGESRFKDYKDNVAIFKSDERKENAIILIQKLLRGRAFQNLMYEGKEKRLALIEELLIVANVEALSEEAVEERLLEAHEERLRDAVVESIQGEVMSRANDMLSKELIRFKQEKKIARLVNIAENDRRKREAEETGRRQAEQTLQKREDLLYQEIMKMHQGTVDTFLDTLFVNAVESASAREAGQMSQIRKEKIEAQIESLENKHSKPQAVIKDLVASFLIPNIQKKKIQKKIALEEKRFAETAKRTMVSTLAEAKEY